MIISLRGLTLLSRLRAKTITIFFYAMVKAMILEFSDLGLSKRKL